jgi:hypothetical protein
MRQSTRSVTAGLALLIALVLTAPAEAAQAGACGRKSVSILFWPKGHNARPGAGFPKFKTPHVEVYGGKHTKKFPTATDVYLDSTGAASLAGQCSVGVTKFSGKAVDGTTRTAAGNIVCGFGETVGYTMGKIKGGARLQIVLADGDVAVDLRIKRSGSRISCGSSCKAHAPPR